MIVSPGRDRLGDIAGAADRVLLGLQEGAAGATLWGFWAEPSPLTSSAGEEDERVRLLAAARAWRSISCDPSALASLSFGTALKYANEHLSGRVVHSNSDIAFDGSVQILLPSSSLILLYLSYALQMGRAAAGGTYTCSGRRGWGGARKGRPLHIAPITRSDSQDAWVLSVPVPPPSRPQQRHPPRTRCDNDGAPIGGRVACVP